MTLIKTETQRAIIELSNMINNDEVFFHFIKDKTLESLLPKLKSGFNNPLVRCVRPVFKEEIQKGLDPTEDWTTDRIFDHIQKHNQNHPFPDITRALDALYILHRKIDNDLKKLQRSPEDSIISFVAYEFYDCMSGGCSVYSLSMCRYLYETHGFDLEKEVYPASNGKGNENGWYTMRMFLEEIKKMPRFESLCPEIAYLEIAG